MASMWLNEYRFSRLDMKIPSPTVSFADVAHGSIIFDRREPIDSLILELVDTAWVQRLRSISQTGNTKLVYMGSEHSRFAHSLGVAFLATSLMKQLANFEPAQVKEFGEAVGAAALLHDLGHVAPGSHLAEKVWGLGKKGSHEKITARVIAEDSEINGILTSRSKTLPSLVVKILNESSDIPPWTSATISGGGWNVDRGNWTILDSAMCAVSYGRYNIQALIDAFRLTNDGRLVIAENRVDALTHFFLARDSMYWQVYQHRTTQVVDQLTLQTINRLRELIGSNAADGVFCDATMKMAVGGNLYSPDVPLQTIFSMTESWFRYHVERWCESTDAVLADLSKRLRDRRLLKTIRLPEDKNEATKLVDRASKLAADSGFDPRYYVAVIGESDRHRGHDEETLAVITESGQVVPAEEVEPLIATLPRIPRTARRWLVVPREIKTQIS